MKKKTKEEFVNKSNEIHNHFYDYSFVDYINNNTKVEIICPYHGSFLQLPSNHISGKGCIDCGVTKTSKSKTKSTKDFIEKSIKIHGNTYDYTLSTYKGNNKELIIKCPIHGIFEQKPRDHYKGKGCSKCAYESLKGLYTPKLAERNKEDWLNISCIFYFIESEINNVKFLKIGLTTGTIYERFRNKLKSYNTITYKDLSLYQGVMLENKLIEKYKDYKIRIDYSFSGYTECFSTEIKDKLKKEILK